jgi:hypothetical protein
MLRAASANRFRSAISASALVMLLALSALVLPADAAAEVQQRSLHLSFFTETADGYEVAVETRGHRQLALIVAKGGVSNVYRTTAKVSRKGIEADLGALGRIAVRFEGRRRPLQPFGLPFPIDLHPDRVCRGRKPVREVGQFTGSIQFEGEGGYTRLQIGSARGEVRRAYRRVCHETRGDGKAQASKERGPLEGGRFNLLVATARMPGRTVKLNAFELELGPKGRLLEELLGTIIGAAVTERREGVRIQRSGVTLGSEAALLVNPVKGGVRKVTLAPERPFGGTALYSATAGSAPSWIGDISVKLLGLGPVPLTGPAFSVEFCNLPIAALESADSRTPCLPRDGTRSLGRLDARDLLAQISGSQSQDFGEARLSWSR